MKRSPMSNASQTQLEEGLDASVGELLDEFESAAAAEERALEDPASNGTLDGGPLDDAADAGNDDAPPTPATIESLDAQLAGLAEDLLGEDAELSPEMAAAAFHPPMPAGGVLKPPTSEHREAQPVPEPVEESRAAEPQLQLPQEDSPGRQPTIIDRAAGQMHAMLAAISAPLLGRPPQVQTAIGWIAAFNIFLAVCIWAYVLLVRQS